LSPEQVAAAAMVAQAREQGLALTGPGGLLKLFTKSVLETALNEEMTEHLGYEKHGADPDRESVNIRNGSRSKTVLWRRGGRGGDRCSPGSGGHV
jgi:putative transposase